MAGCLLGRSVVWCGSFRRYWQYLRHYTALQPSPELSPPSPLTFVYTPPGFWSRAPFLSSEIACQQKPPAAMWNRLHYVMTYSHVLIKQFTAHWQNANNDVWPPSYKHIITIVHSMLCRRLTVFSTIWHQFKNAGLCTIRYQQVCLLSLLL
jgi:hypothetical protein